MDTIVSIFFNLSLELREEKRAEDKNGVFTYKFVYRAKAPNKAFVDGTGTCSSNEKGLLKTEHNTRAIAETRAKNRAIADLVAFGEVSAEEVNPTPAEEMIKDNDPELIKKPIQITTVNKCESCNTTNKYHAKGCPFGQEESLDVKQSPTCHIHNIQLLRGISKTKVDKEGNPKKYWYHPAENGGICFGNDMSDFKKDMGEQKIPERDINEDNLVDDADKALE